MPTRESAIDGSTAVASPPSHSALELVDDLSRAVFELKKQLRLYDPNVVEGDLQDLQASFRRIRGLEIEVAKSISLDWHPLGN